MAANELAERNIRINVVSPGSTATPGLTSVISEEVKQHFASVTALKRLGKPSEIAQTVLFLASDAASFITGTEIIANGGYLNYATK